MDDEFEIEKTKHSELSPGIVKKSERILLAIVQPMNWDGVGFTIDSFKKKDLKECKQSVSRRSFSSPRRIRYFVFDILLAKKPDREAKGLVQFISGDLRSLTAGNGGRAFIVIDAPLQIKNRIDYAHAHMGFSPEIIGAGKSAQAAAILNLKGLLLAGGPPHRPEQFFPVYPLLYIRLSEFRLAGHRLRLWLKQRRYGANQSSQTDLDETTD